MNAFHLAVILIRIMGLWVLIGYVPYLGDLVTRSIMTSSGGMQWDEYTAGTWIAAGVGIVLALGCILKATWLARVVARGCFPPGCCPRCGYNIQAASLKRCPECGHEDTPNTA